MESVENIDPAVLYKAVKLDLSSLKIDILEQYRMVDVTCLHCNETRRVQKRLASRSCCDNCLIDMKDYQMKVYLKTY
jgi:hypothetical protein